MSLQKEYNKCLGTIYSGLKKSVLEEFSGKARYSFRESNYHYLNIAIH